jgi:hypothetical protein
MAPSGVPFQLDETNAPEGSAGASSAPDTDAAAGAGGTDTNDPNGTPTSDTTNDGISSGQMSAENATNGHCAEETIPLVSAYPGPLLNCQDYDPSADGGQISQDATYFRAVVLDEPVSAGDSFAFTVQMDGTTAGTMELWATDSLCGPGLELIASAPMGQALRCLGGTILGGPYDSFVWAWFGAGTHDEVAVCPNASCPAVD